MFFWASWYSGIHKVSLSIAASSHYVFTEPVEVVFTKTDANKRMIFTGFWKYFSVVGAVVAFFATSTLSGCINYGPIAEEEFSYPTPPNAIPQGVFIVCEGNFMYGNASLSFYLPSSGELQNEVFARANGMKLGDVAQSMTIHGSMGYIVVNNSGIIFGVDIDTFKVKKVIKGLGSPRYIHFVGDKAYVTSLYEPRIAVVDIDKGIVAGYIETPGHTSTEQMVSFGSRMYVSCWSYDNTILVVDTDADAVIGEIKVRNQPRQMVADGNEKLWVLTDGGAGGGKPDIPALYRIDGLTAGIEKEFLFRLGDNPKGLAVDGGRETVYYLNDDLWRMSADAEELPQKPFVESANTIYYALGVNPRTDDVYLGDAIDYQQQGIVYRISSEAERLDTLRVGVTPTAFCFK